ncbi:MAG: hypothetical protein COT73_11545 [Bdellovibrio sp. CG10_big_fil_rev_8_21_14_0_10_47_8]|nr:MAG: hypothetical protein COT73_11545 [Bdellovibrio sp. CG10_big_fil_rev_8_21_14_0_10_47_8]
MISLMRLNFTLYFLTLVVLCLSFNISVYAAPERNPRPRPIENPMEKENLDPWILRSIKRKHVFGSTSISAGAGSGVFDKDKENSSPLLVGLERSFYSKENSAQRFGVFIASSTSTLIGARWAYQWLNPRWMSSWLSYEPFYQVGVVGYYDAKDQLGNFIDYQRYYAIGSIGLEDLFRLQRTWRVEMGFGFGNSGTHVFGLLSYAFSDN